jgi:hypothetical protein
MQKYYLRRNLLVRKVMPDPLFAQVEQNIRGLTTAIHLIQVPKPATDTLVPVRYGAHHAVGKAYNKIAILLTQGSDNEVVEPHAVAITGQVQASGVSIIAIAEFEELQPNSDITLNPNGERDLEDQMPLSIDSIKPSGKSLKDLADASKKCVPYYIIYLGTRSRLT